MTDTYAATETGGEQPRVEPGRSHDIRHLASLEPNLRPNTKVSIYRVLMICNESTRNLGHPWLEGAVAKGRVSHPRLGNKITVCGMLRPGRGAQCNGLGHRQSLARSVVDPTCLNGEDSILDK
uniref:Ribosomal protein L21 n=1 Tax=Selaginella sanguinolenta TaxID=493175 RepID=A0A482CHY6_9TRAC|nr:ribosomal protein L21 [Selaginella sanguinolenta]QBL76376.1 ribosomal protein L21 [Selaginella sanguinolenta]